MLGARAGERLALALWYVMSGLLALNKPLTQRASKVYWGGAVVTAVLAVIESLLMLRSDTPELYLTRGTFVATGGCIVLAVWGVLRWPWFMERHWLLKLISGPFLWLPFAIPARILVYVLYVVGLAVVHAV